MRIAVTYENGEVFQHFGRTQEFKVYTVEEGKVVSAEVIGNDGVGHEALAGLLRNRDIDVLICGGIGGGARAALAEQGVAVCAGAAGNADEVVEAYLKGELTGSDEECDHRHEGACGDHDCGHEGGCGHCHEENGITGINVGKVCRTHYRGTFNDGTQFDSSYDRGEPLEFICGAGMMIRGFDAAVANMRAGEKVTVHLMPSEAYGEADPNAVFTVDIDKMPGSENLEAGQRVYLQDMQGRPIPAKVTARDDVTITFDLNHEMAGKELNFEIELVEVRDR